MVEVGHLSENEENDGHGIMLEKIHHTLLKISEM
jgi:hypothetical protein